MKLNFLIFGNYVSPSYKNIFPQDVFKNFITSNSIHNIDFEINPNKTYDVVVIINRVHEKTTIKVKEGNVFCLMVEPGEECHAFMYKNLYQFDKVFSPIHKSRNTILSNPYLPWYISLSYDELIKLKQIPKIKNISCILSNAQYVEGHKKRYAFLNNYLLKSSLPIDYYGRGINFIEKKEDALLDYKYSITIENSSKDYYFSEKITDCFLTYTVPIYYGCANIQKFSPEKSYIWLDINNPTKAMQTLQDIMNNENDYYERLPYIQEARELYFKKYNFVNFIDNVLKNYYMPNLKNEEKKYTIVPVNYVKPFHRKILSLLKRVINKLLIIN